MERQGLSQEQIGERLGWPQRRVSRRLTGDVSISAEELSELAAALGVPVTRFLADQPAVTP